MRLIKNISVCCLTMSFLACKKPVQNIPHYTVSKEFKSDTLTTVNVHIANRLTAAQLVLIAGKIKTDSARIQNLAIHYLLPGNTDLSAGEHSYYASARYLRDNELKPTDTIKDENSNALRLKIFGLDSIGAQQLLLQQPDVLLDKKILGRFVDDYSRTVIIPFKDPTDKKDELFVIEADVTGKIVSATVPRKKVEDGVDKWLVTQSGDYITIKDSVLAQYSADGLGMPFNSIKSGI